MATNNSINSSIPNSPAGVINIGTNSVAQTITIGNTTGATAVALNTGTGDFTLASATGTTMLCADEGWITYQLKPGFLAGLGTDDNNVTGDGTTYTLGGGNALTEIFDQNGDFTTAGVFTAPVTGRYFFIGAIRGSHITSAMTSSTIRWTTSNRNYILTFNPFPIIFDTATLQQVSFYIAVIADMDSGDTSILQLNVSGGGKTLDVRGFTTITWIMGGLLV